MSRLDRFPIQRVVQVDPETGEPIEGGGGASVPVPLPVTDNGGSLTVDGTVGISGTVPISAASLPTHGVSQSGTWTVGPPTGTQFSRITDASTNRVLIVGAAANVDVILVSNPTATAAWLKVYDKVSAPAVGDTTLLRAIIPIPANSFQSIPFPNSGLRLSAGFGIAVTANQAASDDTATVAGIIISGTRR